MTIALGLVLLMVVVGNRERHRDDMESRKFYEAIFKRQAEQLEKIISELEALRDSVND